MGTVNAPDDAASPPRLPVVLAAAVELRGLAVAAAAADRRAPVASGAMLSTLELLSAMESERAAAPGAAAVIDVDRLTVPSIVASSDTSETRSEVAAVDAVPAAVVRASSAAALMSAAANMPGAHKSAATTRHAEVTVSDTTRRQSAAAAA